MSKSLMNVIRVAALAAMAAIPGLCQCGYSIAVENNPMPASGGVVALYVNTAPGCSWQISHTSSFLSYYGARTGSGPATVYLWAAPYGGRTARTGPVYVQKPYQYVCGQNIGGRSGGGYTYCTGYTNAGGTTMVQN